MRASDLTEQAEESMRSSRSRDMTASQIRELQDGEIARIKGVNGELTARLEETNKELELTKEELGRVKEMLKKEKEQDVHLECRKKMEGIVVDLRNEH